MVEERSKHPLKLSEKLAGVYKVQKKAKKMQKRLAKWPGVWYYT
jgi:L-serine deaminase